MSAKTKIKLRLDQSLLDALKELAVAENQSLNSYIEKVLREDIEHIPNATTLEALEEARNGKLERIEHIDEWLEKL